MAKDFSLLIKAFEEAYRDALDAVLPDVATAVSLAAKAYSQRTIMERGFGEIILGRNMKSEFYICLTKLM